MSAILQPVVHRHTLSRGNETKDENGTYLHQCAQETGVRAVLKETASVLTPGWTAPPWEGPCAVLPWCRLGVRAQRGPVARWHAGAALCTPFGARAVPSAMTYSFLRFLRV